MGSWDRACRKAHTLLCMTTQACAWDEAFGVENASSSTPFRAQVTTDRVMRARPDGLSAAGSPPRQFILRQQKVQKCSVCTSVRGLFGRPTFYFKRGDTFSILVLTLICSDIVRRRLVPIPLAFQLPVPPHAHQFNVIKSLVCSIRSRTDVLLSQATRYFRRTRRQETS